MANLLSKLKSFGKSVVGNISSAISTVTKKIIPSIADNAGGIFTSITQACTGNFVGAAASASAVVGNIVSSVGGVSSSSASSSNTVNVTTSTIKRNYKYYTKSLRG